jgi:hypothetical protein
MLNTPFRNKENYLLILLIKKHKKMTKLTVEKQLNAFAQSQSRGFVDNDQNSYIYEGILANADEDQVTSAGDLVKLVEGNGKVPTFAEVDPTDKEAFGFVVHNLKQRHYKTKDFIGIVSDYAIIYGIANEDIVCGNKLVYIASVGESQGKIGVNTQTGATGLIPVGVALSGAKEGGLVKFLVKLGKITPVGASGTSDDSNVLTIKEGIVTAIA